MPESSGVLGLYPKLYPSPILGAASCRSVGGDHVLAIEYRARSVPDECHAHGFRYPRTQQVSPSGRAQFSCALGSPLFCKPAHLLRNSHAPPSLSILSYYYMMAQRAQETKEDSPKFTTRFTIDCVLPLASTQLQADGCVLENLEDGHKLISPEYLRTGDLVKIQMWLEGDQDFVDIPLAVVNKVAPPWIVVGVIR